MKRINLYAYFEDNVGDDLMVDILLKRYPDCMFFSPYGCYETTDKFLKYKNFRNMEYYYRKYGRINRILNILTFNRFKNILFDKIFAYIQKSAICSVYIGGSLFQQNINETVNKRISRELRQLRYKPLFIIGANFGPYYTEDFKNEFAKYFGLCQGVSFRDTYSYELFSNIPQVTYAPDVVFNIKSFDYKNATLKNKVLISVIDTLSPSRKELNKFGVDYENFITKICEAVVRQGNTPVLISFCKKEGDETAVDRIYNTLQNKTQLETLRYYYKDSLDEVIDLFINCKFVFATRFHAMIMALCFKKPFFAISYNSKVSNVLDDIGSNSYCDIKDIINYNPQNIMKEIRDSIDCQDYTNKAKNHFKQLDKYIERVD